MTLDARDREASTSRERRELLEKPPRQDRRALRAVIDAVAMYLFFDRALCGYV